MNRRIFRHLTACLKGCPPVLKNHFALGREKRGSGEAREGGGAGRNKLV